MFYVHIKLNKINKLKTEIIYIYHYSQKISVASIAAFQNLVHLLDMISWLKQKFMAEEDAQISSVGIMHFIEIKRNEKYMIKIFVCIVK